MAKKAIKTEPKTYRVRLVITTVLHESTIREQLSKQIAVGDEIKVTRIREVKP